MIDSTLFKRAHPQGYSSELDNAITSMTNLFAKQAQHVVKVTLMPNFSIDHDRSAAEETPIYHGLVVNLKDTYELSPEDKCWFHPEMGKGRSVFEGGSVKDTLVEQTVGDTNALEASLSPFNSSAGEYYSQTEDAYGMVDKHQYSIVSSGSESTAYPLWSSWCDSYTSMKKVYSAWKSNNAVDTIQTARTSIVNSNKTIYQDVVNNIYSDGKTLYVSNHAVKCNAGDKVLCEISPTAGYIWFHIQDGENKFVASDCGYTNEYVNIHALREQHKQRFYKDCSWLSKKPFNTYVMRKTSITPETIASCLSLKPCERVYMKTCTCSSQPVKDAYETDTLLKLTPLHQAIHVPFKPSNDIVKYVLDNYHEINKTHPTFDLINPTYLKNGTLELPREIVEMCQ